MGSTYFGEGAFGEAGLYEVRISVSAATSVAEFPAPAVQGSVTNVASPASAAASMPIPVALVRITAPASAAVAALPEPDVQGSLPKADRPTTLALEARSESLGLADPAILVVDPRATALALGDRAPQLQLDAPISVLVFPTGSELILDPNATTLTTESHERILTLDG